MTILLFLGGKKIPSPNLQCTHKFKAIKKRSKVELEY
jgi:hypothetical protein